MSYAAVVFQACPVVSDYTPYIVAGWKELHATVVRDVLSYDRAG